MGLKCESVMRGDVGVVYCRGKIVFGEEDDELRLRVLELLRNTPRIVLHLASVTQIDSSSLGTLVGLYISSRNRGGEIKLGPLSPKVREVLRTMKLTELFDIRESEEEAVAAFATGNRAASA